MSLELTQKEADALLKMEKHCENTNNYTFADINPSLRFALKSLDGREEFMLDIFSGKIEISKYSYNHRARKTVVIARVDISGAPHRNPDGKKIECPHLHVYKEGFGDKWAYPLPDEFKNASDPWQVLQDFMGYCNIKGKPNIEKGIFS